MRRTDDMPASELRDLIARLTERDGVRQSAISSLYLIRFSAPHSPDFGVIYPGLCIVAQGQKELLLGDEVFSTVPACTLFPLPRFPFQRALSERPSPNPTSA
jgi:AraC-type transcriptional regulator N-terminus